MIRLLTFIMCGFAAFASFGQAPEYPSLKTQAEDVVRATAAEDFKKVVDYTHPRAIEKVGGREKLIAASQDAFAEIKRMGISFIGTEIGKPLQIEKIGSQIFAVVPQHVVMKVGEVRYASDGFLLGISDDGGANWKFVDGAAGKALLTIFPEIVDKIKLPERSGPTRIDNQ